MSKPLPIAIIGAGPVGLAALAHLLERGENPIAFESGDAIGANVRAWAHIRMFSPWTYTVDSATVRLLEPSGWKMPPTDDLPTGDELRNNYLLPFAALPQVRDRIHLNASVVAISRRNIDKMKDAGREEAPFILHIAYADGHEAIIEARAVIDASGTWNTPNPLGSGGLPAVGERAQSAHIFYGIPDIGGTEASRYANKRVMVVGSGHSAINALLELVKLQTRYPQTQAIWVMRRENLTRVYGGAENDGLTARGQLGSRIQAHVEAGAIQLITPFSVCEIQRIGDDLSVKGETPQGIREVTVDEVIATTGARPNLDMLRELRLDLDPSLESPRVLGPMIDPNIHSCGSVPPHGETELRQPEKDFYIVGMKSYGRAPTFLLATGYEQVRSVAAALVGDWQAAQDVQLQLPETGVCSTDLDGNGGSCCSSVTNTVAVVPTLQLINFDSITLNVPILQSVEIENSVRDCGCDSTCCS